LTLSAATLESELASLVPTSSEATAINRLVSAWQAYFGEATVSGAPLVPASISGGLSAMAAAMVGLSAPGAAAGKIAAGASAFWSTQAGLATTMWVTAPVVLVPPIVPPPGLASLSSALAAVFAAGPYDLDEALNQIASAWHAASTGATVPGSVPPAPPAPLVVT
jgi:hypothetical protein